MITARKDKDIIVFNPVDQTVSVIDASAPAAGQIAAQRFRFADALVPISVYILEKLVDSFKCFSVFSLPVNIILPAVFGKQLIHLLPRSDSGQKLFLFPAVL